MAVDPGQVDLARGSGASCQITGRRRRCERRIGGGAGDIGERRGARGIGGGHLVEVGGVCVQAGVLVAGHARCNRGDLHVCGPVRRAINQEAGFVARSIIRPGQIDLAAGDRSHPQVARC